MAKKKSNDLGLLFNCFVTIGLVLLIVGICLSIWTEAFIGLSGGVGIFADKSGLDYAVFGTICEILLLSNLVLVTLYAVLFCFDTFKIGKFKYAKLLKVLSLVILCLAVLALVFGVLYSVLTTNVQYKDLNTFYVKPAVGFYLMVAGSMVAGVFGFLANLKK